MKLYLIKNRDEWISTLDKLFESGYHWIHLLKHPAPMSFDDWYDNKDMKNFENPVVIWCNDDKTLRWCTLNYLEEKFYEEWFKLMRKEKLKKLKSIAYESCL